MKFQTLLLSQVLLHTTQASSLPNDFRRSLTSKGKSPLEWSKCNLDFKNELNNEKQKSFDCATLQVPLDYTNAGNSETINLDLIRVKATKAPFMGSVLYNPGGPGMSAVETLLSEGEKMIPILGGQYDIIGFDTRGTGRTIPFICNKTGEEANVTDKGKLHRREFNTLTQIDLWETLKKDLWEASRVYAESCWQAMQDTGRFIGTPFVARDMMSIVNALDQGPQLHFWGTSYGTVLGQVAASMFPDRIGRMLLDGNLRADDYATTQWLTSLRDTERALKHLFDECVSAGTELCPLADYHGKNTSGESLMRTFGDKFERLRNEPPGDLNATDNELLLTKVHLLKASIMAELYSPLTYPSIVSRIEGLFTGNETAMLPPDESTPNTGWNVLEDVFPGIACSDTSFRVEDPDDQFSMYQAHVSQGSFAETTFPSRFRCAQWKFVAAEQIDLNKLRNLKTSSPILVVNGRYDPVTSLSGAWEMSSQLRGSRVVVHQGVGHGLASHPSNCTQGAIARYFIDGKIPELNTTCLPDMNAFEYAYLQISQAQKNETKQPEIAK